MGRGLLLSLVNCLLALLGAFGLLLLICFNLPRFGAFSLSCGFSLVGQIEDEGTELASHRVQRSWSGFLHPLGELADFLEGTFLLLDLSILLRLQASVNLR